MSGRWPISVSCEVLEVSVSGYFDRARRQSAQQPGKTGRGARLSDEAVVSHIRVVHAEVGQEYGWPRMTRELVARGHRVGKERVRRLMQLHGIQARGKRKFVVTTDSEHSLPLAPNLLQRDFTAEAPDLKWTSDITYIETEEGWLYLAAILDLHQSPGRWLEHAAAHAGQPGHGRSAHGLVPSQAGARIDRAQRPWKPILQSGIPGCAAGLRHALIDEPQGRLLGQCAHGKLVGALEGGQTRRAKVCHASRGDG